MANQLLFTSLHRMQTRSSDEKAVRPSVKRVHQPSLLKWIMVGGGERLLIPELLRQLASVGANRRFWTDIRS